MKTKMIDGVEVITGSANVYADLDLADPGQHKLKSDLAIQIIKAIKRLNLTQQEAAKRMGISQPKVSDMVRGNFSNLSERKLMDCLNRLGYNIEIKLSATDAMPGQVVVAFA